MQYNPHEYQTYATDFILTHPVAAILLECGLGKTAITLTAIQELCLNRFEIRKVLVVAPLRVAQSSWPGEFRKWDHLKDLTFAVATGTEAERLTALRKNAFVTIINRENVRWLVEKSGVPFDFEMVVLDELSSFKSHQAKRFRSLLKVRPSVKRMVGLTGTPSSNGLMDLWAEFRLLDMGKRLGRFITHYRDEFFVPDKRSQQVVFSYKPKPGAEREIYKRISDITISMKSTDYLRMPACVMNEIRVELSERERALYDQMRTDMVLSLKGEDIALGVDKNGAGDQGIMYGYATNETDEMLPIPFVLATKALETLAENRYRCLRPDAKSQVTYNYATDKIDTFLISTQHTEDVDLADVRGIVRNVMMETAKYYGKNTDFRVLINPTGRFVTGGSFADTGLTGRKIICDTYGGACRHGGGALSGKDPTKVDRSAAYMARKIAKDILRNGFAKRCEVQLAYAIGVAEPVSVGVDCFGTNRVPKTYIVHWIRKHYDLTPTGIISLLELRDVDYTTVSKLGHFWRRWLPWEK